MTVTLAPPPERIDHPEVSGPPRRSAVSRLAGLLGSRLLQSFLVLVALFWLMPVFGLLISSLRSEVDNGDSGWWTIFTAPAQLTLDNYQQLLADSTVLSALWNTVLISVPATLLVVVISSLAAYALAWMDFRGRDWLMVGIVGMLVMPIQVALIPTAKLYGAVDIFGTLPGVILFHVAFGLPFGVFLLRNFFSGVPKDLLEAARMDGASEWVVFRRVIMPIGLPAIASLGIFQFLWVWNDLLVALVFAGTDNQPITVALQSQLRQFGSNIDMLAAGSFVSMLVPLAVFFSLQRFFVQGVLAGSTK
ncbi:carbohydrate ABC transporter membrane protein 2, CUT1 family [Amycolatopsis marina]|uniref:Carbohydrate ABC transporter membrane protein 2, CUT1 family n=1 Tax=Amycolatopsis marina TaxID=490629 RepID=A0A1I1ARG6_9PSEU|nr:carbohydrate ABC transporter permease [Amycolatopsis marina]SFB40507.1 carbohydrate ABC transporter membrane protein 2, CUT1 family [Amycolatopsis marina]